MVEVTVAGPGPSPARAIILGVDSKRRAPGLKRAGLAGEPALKAVLADADLSLAAKTVRPVPVAQGWAILVGMGDPKRLTQEKIGALANLGCRAAAGLGVRVAATTLVTDTWGDEAAAQAVTHGCVIGLLDFDQWKSKPSEYRPEGPKPRKFEAEQPRPPVRLERLELLVEGAALARAVERATVVAEAVNDSRLLSNTPPNIANPRFLAAEAQRRGKEQGFKVTAIGREQLRDEGYGALCGVAQGSANEEQLIVMDYDPPAPKGARKGAKKTLAVVGKGVCFDSGGISLKPGDKMWEMKYDKVGACNVIALMAALKRLGVRHRVVGIVPAVENLPSGTAQRPGDIVTAKDGTTIEVLNTDAEGRLILADAIAHARTFEPEWIIDMATLTGACDVAVGPTYVAVMSSDDRFAQRLVADSLEAGDKAWQLPQGEEYDEANKGAYADLQNISLTNRAGTCIGGSFLKHFAKDTKWAHLDIASKAWTAGADYYAKGPTGAGLRIVLQRILSE